MECCNDCLNKATWVRQTQFSGDHYFCLECALKESRFGEDDSYQIWHEIMGEFKGHKFCDNTMFLRGFGTTTDDYIINSGSGQYRLFLLEKEIEKAKEKYYYRLDNIFNFLKEYSNSVKYINNKTINLEFNIEKFLDNLNLGIIEKNTYNTIKLLSLEKHINVGECKFINFRLGKDLIYKF